MDLIMRVRAELVFTQLLEHLDHNQPPSLADICGLTIRQNGNNFVYAGAATVGFGAAAVPL